jgi:hypothetical protein
VRRHTDALKALIQTVPALATKTFVTLAPTTAVPYVVIHPMDGNDESTRLAGPASTQHPRFVIHSVGSTYEQCAAIAEAVKSKLVVGGFGVAPVVVGELSGRLEYSSPQPIQVDRDVTPALCYHVAEVTWTGEPA